MKDLNFRYSTVTRTSFDWGGNRKWKVVHPEVTDDSLGYYELEYDTDDFAEINDSILGSSNYDPVMNFYLDLYEEVEKAQGIANLLYDTCLTVVIVDEDRVCLALTGGGMDMVWDICRAFMKLGSVPPTSYCRLPEMAGEYDEDVIAACNKGLQGDIDQATWAMGHNLNLRNYDGSKV